jgi:hypothetical protein
VSDDLPQMRASYAKTVIGGVKKLPGAQSSAVLERIGSAWRAEIREYGMLDWMPAHKFVALVDVIALVLGVADARAFWCDSLRMSMERRLLTPLRLGAIAVYGNSPRSLLKMTPQAWQLVSKDAGNCETVDLPSAGIELHFRDLPAILCVPSMLLLWTGGSEACIQRMGFSGQARSRVAGLPAGEVKIVVEWSAQGAQRGP